MKETIVWLRRDLRLIDHRALHEACKVGTPVQLIFIFDQNILSQLEDKSDARISFIHHQLEQIDSQLREFGGGLQTYYGDPIEVWKTLVREKNIESVHFNEDYEPYAIKRDNAIKELLNTNGVNPHSYKDQVIFAKNEILKDDGSPYTVYTPFSKKWLNAFDEKQHAKEYAIDLVNCAKVDSTKILSLNEIGFEKNMEVDCSVPDINSIAIDSYDQTRDFPGKDQTTRLGHHLRFGTVSTRQLVRKAHKENFTFLKELIWREFFAQILFHFPRVVNESFKSQYDGIEWLNRDEDIKAWMEGRTGYPMVDAGMRELNSTGFMHNRVRMVVASFLTKHLLVDWRIGEAYFASELLDFDLASNNGNWQWAAGCGCDAAPYFRVFNPTTQREKFDPDQVYVRRWIPELQELTYPNPIVEHKFARERALSTYKKGLGR